MSQNTCMARLLASAVHDMRNILAIIRESAGLAQDLTSLDSTPQDTSTNIDLQNALDEVRRQVLLAAQLAEGLEFMAQGATPSCDLGRVCRLFCRMAARQARAAQTEFKNGEPDGPVWVETPSMEVFQALLDVLDICISVGGRVSLLLTAGHHQGKEGIELRVAGGENAHLVLSALTGSPAGILAKGRLDGGDARIIPGPVSGSFFLTFSTGGGK